MEERRVSFAAQNEIDAEQAFLNSMKALQESDEAFAPTPSGKAVPVSSIRGGDGGMEKGENGGDITALVGDTEEEATPHPGAGASTNIATATTTAAAAATSSGNSSPVVNPDVQENTTSSPSSSSSSSIRRTAAPFSYDDDEEDNESGSAAAVKVESDDSARSPTPTAPSLPNLAPVESNGHHVSSSPPVSAHSPTNSNTSPSVSLVVSEESSTPNATPLPTTANEIPQSINTDVDVSKEPAQAATGVISNSNTASVPSPAPTGAAVSTPTTSASTPVNSNKRKRLPQDRVGQLEDRIAEDPRGDIDAWLHLISEHQKKGKFDEARAAFERFFLVFPACVRTGFSPTLSILVIRQ